jgi:hypothetical protein
MEYFNKLESKESAIFEEFITRLMSHFIKLTKSKKDFSDILESVSIAGFSKQNINIIEWAIKP